MEKHFNIKFWNITQNRWDEAVQIFHNGAKGAKYLDILCNDKIIEKGIYVIIFRPNDNYIYEIRDLKKPEKVHKIHKDLIVIKGGKFEDGFGKRLIGNNGYAKYWRNEDDEYERDPETNELIRTLSDCIATNCDIYLIQMLNEYDKLVQVNEALLFNVLHDVFDDIKPQEGKKSEYYKINENDSGIIYKISNDELEEKMGEIVRQMEIITNVTSSILLTGFEHRIPIIFKDFDIDMDSDEAKEIAVLIKLAARTINPNAYIPFYETQWLLEELLNNESNSVSKEIKRDFDEVEKIYQQIIREMDCNDFLPEEFFTKDTLSHCVNINEYLFMFYLHYEDNQKKITLQFRQQLIEN